MIRPDVFIGFHGDFANIPYVLAFRIRVSKIPTCCENKDVRNAFVEGQNTLQLQLPMPKGVERQGANESFQAGKFQEGERIRTSLFSQTALSPDLDLSLLSFEQFTLTSPHWMKETDRPENNICDMVILCSHICQIFVWQHLYTSHHTSKF